jgi:hypothetical protein
LLAKRRLCALREWWARRRSAPLPTLRTDAGIRSFAFSHFSLPIVGDRTDAVENFGFKFCIMGTGEFDA